MGDQAIEVFVVGAGNIEVPAADIEDRFIVNEECAISVLNGAVC